MKPGVNPFCPHIDPSSDAGFSGEGVLISRETTTCIKRQLQGRDSARVWQRAALGASRRLWALDPRGFGAAPAASAPLWRQPLPEFCLITSFPPRHKGKFLSDPGVRPFFQRHGPSPKPPGFFKRPAESSSGTPWAKRLT